MWRPGQCLCVYRVIGCEQVESGRSDSVASRGSLHSTEEVSAAAGPVSAPSRPTDSNDVTSFSIRRPVSYISAHCPAHLLAS